LYTEAPPGFSDLAKRGRVGRASARQNRRFEPRSRAGGRRRRAICLPTRRARIAGHAKRGSRPQLNPGGASWWFGGFPQPIGHNGWCTGEVLRRQNQSLETLRVGGRCPTCGDFTRWTLAATPSAAHSKSTRRIT